MKTIRTFTLIAAICLSTNNFAQKTTIGVTGGYNTSTYSPFDFENPYNGWNLGLTGVWSSMSHWGVGADIIYTRTGGTYTQFSNTRNRNINYRVQNDNIRITPKFHYFFGDLEDKIRPTLFIGPSLGIHTRADNLSNTIDWSNEFKPVEFAGVVGGGVNYQILSGLWLHGNVNYTVGITELNDSPVISPDDLRTNSLGFNLGLVYSLNKIDKAVQ